MKRIGTGHINDTYLVSYDEGPSVQRYILQRLNEEVFPDIPSLMSNVERVLHHLRTRVACAYPGQENRRVLTLLLSRSGHTWIQTADGYFWRAYLFIDRARTHDVLPGPDVAREVARAFARFLRDLSDLPLPRLHETIPGFHDTPARLEALEKAIDADFARRANECRSEIAFVRQRADQLGRLHDLQQQGVLPERVSHNDTKINNVLIDNRTGQGICVIDLDTVMPGVVLHDFGDMVRTAVSPAPEDERDLSNVLFRTETFEALSEGFISEARHFLTPAEVDLLSFSGWLITLETGIRFLTDYLAGDVYFRIHRPGQNLDRCRTQFRLVECMEQEGKKLDRIVYRSWEKPPVRD